MAQYTEQLQNIRYEISPEDENYTEELLAVIRMFREFDEALDHFIVSKGFVGDITDVDAKVEFIKNKFKEASVSPIPGNVKKWFTEKRRIEKRRNY